MLSKLNDILGLIEKSKKKKTGDEWVNLGSLTRVEVQRYEQSTGVNLSGYKRVFSLSEMRKIIKSHGKESNDPCKLDYDEFLLIPFILSNPDTVSLSGHHSKTNNLQVIRSKKMIGENYIIIEEVRKGRKSLAILSMYKKPAKRS